MPPYNKTEFQATIDQNDSIQSHLLMVGAYETHYYQTSDTQTPDIDKSARPLVIFIHGSPGGAHGYAAYLNDQELTEQATLVAIDRYGFGQSSRIPYENKLKDQAVAIYALIKTFPNTSKVILVGHSYGGPVAAQTAIDYPDAIDGVLFLAPAVDPSLEKTKWFQYVAKIPLIEWIIPRPLREANDEIMPLKQQLEQIENQWDKLSARIIVIQGTKDNLVPKGNAAFIKDKRPTSQIIYIENEGHFLPWRHFDKVKGNILTLLNTQNAQ